MIAEPIPALRRIRNPKGREAPRIAPPTPAKSDLKTYRDTAKRLGIEPMKWQLNAARYLMALNPDGGHLYREVVIEVARQNGKTTLVKPLIVAALEAGLRIMHMAQTRELPRHMFTLVASEINEELLPKRRGRGGKPQTIWPRYGAGQEEILLENGGAYRIAAITRGGARGWTNDLVIIDETRELYSMDAIDDVKPSLTASPDPQIIYLTNAGSAQSVVLNALRKRRDEDPDLAFLEWSAAPDRDPDDVEGWAEANPAMGHEPPGMGSVYKSLISDHRAAFLGGTMPGFETEHLCRTVSSLLRALVAEGAWDKLRGPLQRPTRAYLAVAVDPLGRRASAAVAGPQPDGAIGVRVIADVSPVNLDRLGPDLVTLARKFKVTTDVAFDPVTDLGLARHFRKRKAMAGAEFWNATGTFVQRVELGQIRWQDAEMVSEDLRFTARKEHSTGVFGAIRADDEHTNTAALAVMRAVWLASNPRLTQGSAPTPRVK